MSESAVIRLVRDLSVAIDPFPAFAVIDPTSASTLLSHGRRSSIDSRVADFGEQLVVVVESNLTGIERTEDAEELAVDVADVLQDHVMDQLGRGWPELTQNGEFVGLLRPALDENHRAVWSTTDGRRVDFGSLAQVAID